ncbi:hypothetical protein BST81_08610 [Leptolyngbya sp. 'hensonii']|uniref:glycosyltransferase family 2 protein n=1 Tax=Leptolyngbya sp. 'hensonii' TaxID=1922337 RepID=UPI00094FA8B9|nr:glycosyltransferase family 2 protein [Leptolyngbya sp. 'hensonii']OLP18791.1 hypothetical protein BST81_08610 [Leptolyngbya sp. 'hensonii']
MSLLLSPLQLKDLPTPPPGKVGWPWTKQAPPLPQYMPNGQEWPLISIVTPSFNQDQFLEATIRSVLLQGYPRIEYIILDGGSTDQSPEIIQKYAPYLTFWVSEPDGGQAAAINRGFCMATGDLVGWQNSDDYYHHGTFRQAAELALSYPEADVLYGPTTCIDAQGIFLRPYPVSEFTIADSLPFLNVCNQAMFFRQKVFADGHFLDDRLHHVMDHEFLVRLNLLGYRFVFGPRIAGYFRYHAETKGATAFRVASDELMRLYAFIYRQPQLSRATHRKAVACMRSLCLDNFGKLRLDLFRHGVRQKLQAVGPELADLDLLVKYGLSFLGQDFLDDVKGLKSRLFSRRVQD